MEQLCFHKLCSTKLQVVGNLSEASSNTLAQTCGNGRPEVPVSQSHTSTLFSSLAKASSITDGELPSWLYITGVARSYSPYIRRLPPLPQQLLLRQNRTLSSRRNECRESRCARRVQCTGQVVLGASSDPAPASQRSE